MASTDILERGITKLAQSPKEIAAIQQHVKELTEGDAFKSSRRCGQFLKYVVDQSISGNFELLKERAIGTHLFGRPAAYDTAEDAIVRGTAAEVRKRLLQHYGGTAGHSDFRITLPLGSYIPSITRLNGTEGMPAQGSETRAAQCTLSPGEADAWPSENPSERPPGLTKHSSADGLAASNWKKWPIRHWIIIALLLLSANAGFWYLIRHSLSRSMPWPLSSLPWSAFFTSVNPTVVITSDPNMAEIEGYTGQEISISDYANHNYFVGPNKLTSEEQRFCRIVLRGDKAASVDTPIAVSAGELAESVSRDIEVRGARDIQLAELRTDSNFILLGSPRSNPWSGLFSSQLDFRFANDKTTQREFIVNAHPQRQEQKTYIPTALGWATGVSYAIVAFIDNPDSTGHILLLAGASSEGTEAAGRLVTDRTRLLQALGKCGLNHPRVPVNFEMLLELSTLAGSSDQADVIACHLLKNHPS